jgi:polyisoprenyl-phosphate glycosyltransferase
MISIVVPVYNSAPVIGETIDRIVRVCDREKWTYEVIAVNDGSTDASADVLRAAAVRHERLRIIDCDANRGQHAALLRGLRTAQGDLVACLDDDLQHPPEAIPALIDRASAGHDVVFARFAQPQHVWWRRGGSALMRGLDRHVFGAPAGLAVSSFRVMNRRVVDSVCAYGGPVPYIRGQMLVACTSPAHVDVQHQRRPGGHSSYTGRALVTFVVRVLLEWSRIPAYAALVAGIALLAIAALDVSTLARLLLLVHGAALGVVGAAGVGRRLPQERRVSPCEAGGDVANTGR